MAKNHMKNSSQSLAIKEMPIKTTLRVNLTLDRITIIKNTNNKKCLQGWGKKNPHTLLVGIQASTTTLEINMETS
jgi:hypothetical protein